MTSYIILKHLHMTTAYLTITLFALRLLLDAVGRPGWRAGDADTTKPFLGYCLRISGFHIVYVDAFNL